MVGDYLFALAAGEMAQAPDPRIISYFSHAVMQICEGELSPVTLLTPLDAALSQYYFKTGSKTASLFAAACKAGMASGGGSPEQIEALGHFGYELGLAFQIVDDVLDFVGNPTNLGKPAGNDMRQGTITLPLIYAAASSDAERLAQALDSHDEMQLQWAIGAAQRLGISPARGAAQQRIERAMHHLEGFPDSPARQVLGDIAAFVLEREV
jgi:heptaprenyl diphosphate synthase/octaprenyl-diphosphate synthase